MNDDGPTTYVGGMPDWSQVRTPHVLAAIEEYDRLGSKEFLSRYGFRRAHAYKLWHRGEEYDSKAILGVAYLHATGRPATSDEFSSGERGAAKVLIGLGFDVVAEKEPVAESRPSAAPRAKPRAAQREPTRNVCPRCHVALPATGVCDFCD